MREAAKPGPGAPQRTRGLRGRRLHAERDPLPRHRRRAQRHNRAERARLGTSYLGDGWAAWPWVLLAVFAGIYTADLVSGLLHWAFDTWLNEDITLLRRMVLQVRERHVYPNRNFRVGFLHDAGTLSWIALILTAAAHPLGEGCRRRAGRCLHDPGSSDFKHPGQHARLPQMSAPHRQPRWGPACCRRAVSPALDAPPRPASPGKPPGLRLLPHQRLGRPHPGPPRPLPRPRMGDRPLEQRASAAQRSRMVAPIRNGRSSGARHERILGARGEVARGRPGDWRHSPALLGVRPVSLGEGEAKIELTASERLHNAMRTVGGSIFCDLADVAMGAALATVTAEGESFSTLQLQMIKSCPSWKAGSPPTPA